jgi:hypothetical protein
VQGRAEQLGDGRQGGGDPPELICARRREVGVLPGGRSSAQLADQTLESVSRLAKMSGGIVDRHTGILPIPVLPCWSLA